VFVDAVPISSAEATRSVGNASTEGYSATITIYEPGSTAHHKRAFITAYWTTPSGVPFTFPLGGCQLDNTGALTGFTVYASSDLTGGTLILLGVE
jgi:hypothetical protein